MYTHNPPEQFSLVTRAESTCVERCEPTKEQSSIPVDQDPLRGLLSGRFVGAFDEFAVLEGCAGTNECDQVRRVDRTPAGLSSLDQLVGHSDSRRP